MSETNSSLQVWTASVEACVGRLQELGFNGFVFRGAKGWLTVVPYGGQEGINLSSEALAQWAAALSAPVLLYSSHDYGWGFQVALSDGRTTSFERLHIDLAELGMEPGTQITVVEAAVLSGLVSQAWIDRLVQQMAPAPDGGEEARSFARDMGFPEFEWLSPFYVTDDPSGALGRGGQEIGHRPQSRPPGAYP